MKQNVGKAVKIAVLTGWSFCHDLPVFVGCFYLLKNTAESISILPTLFPAMPQFENYIMEALAVAPLAFFICNSIIVAGGGTPPLPWCLLCCSPTVFTIYEFLGQSCCLLLYLSTMMIPAELPSSRTSSRSCWLDGHLSGHYSANGNSGFYIYMMRSILCRSLHPLQSGQGGRLQRLALPLESHDPYE